MTNYEWLVENGKLGEFLTYCHSSPWNYVCSKYKIDSTTPYISSTTVADWLGEEHKEVTKWVRLQDVLNLVKASIDIDPMKKYLGLEILQMHDAYRIHLGDEISKLETKEIEE